MSDHLYLEDVGLEVVMMRQYGLILNMKGLEIFALDVVVSIILTDIANWIRR